MGPDDIECSCEDATVVWRCARCGRTAENQYVIWRCSKSSLVPGTILCDIKIAHVYLAEREELAPWKRGSYAPRRKPLITFGSVVNAKGWAWPRWSPMGMEETEVMIRPGDLCRDCAPKVAEIRTFRVWMGTTVDDFLPTEEAWDGMKEKLPWWSRERPWLFSPPKWEPWQRRWV